MRTKFYILLLFFGIALLPQTIMSQVDFNQRPDDDLGNVDDKFKEYFFEAIKQKSIENYQKSVDALLVCIEMNGNYPVLYYELGKNYMLLKNFGAAEEAFEEAVSKAPTNEWFLDELYGVYMQQNKTSKALKTVKQLVEYHPDYKQDLASLYIQLEKYKEAIKLLDELDEQYGYNKERDYLRNQVYNLTGNDDDRIENLEERVASNPEDESNYLRLIYRYSQTGETDKAFIFAKRLLEFNPESQLVHLALYKFYLDDNAIDQAIASMKVVLTSPIIKPEAKTKVLNDFVKFVGQNPQYEQQLIEVTALVSEDKSVKTLVGLAEYYLKSNDQVKALQYYEEALLQEPNTFNIIRAVLLLQIELNKDEDAVLRSYEALDIFPTQPVLYLINGVANNKIKQPKKAIESLEMGLEFLIENPTMQADFYRQLSESYQQLNNIDQSQTFAEKARALMKDN